MSYKISVVHRANIHISKGIEWCIEQEEGMEIRFLKALDTAINYIQKNPLKSQVRYRNVRIRFLRSPKFGVHYYIKGKHIYIIGVFHTNQDSENW